MVYCIARVATAIAEDSALPAAYIAYSAAAKGAPASAHTDRLCFRNKHAAQVQLDYLGLVQLKLPHLVNWATQYGAARHLPKIQ